MLCLKTLTTHAFEKTEPFHFGKANGHIVDILHRESTDSMPEYHNANTRNKCWLTRDIRIMKFTTKVLKPLKTSPTKSALQNTDFSQRLN